MSTSRPVTRVFLVHGTEPATVTLSARLADELATRGVAVARHELGSAPEGTARADVALWLPDGAGRTHRPATEEVRARVQVALVVDAELPRGGLAFDALLVPHERLVEPVQKAAARLVAEPPEVIAARLPLGGPAERDPARRGRRLPDAPVVVVDVRDEMDLERVVFQLALRRERGTVVLVALEDPDTQQRLRDLCDRHGVDAWLTTGSDGLCGSLDVAELCIGRLGWAELCLAAAAGAAVDWFGDEAGRGGTLAAELRALKAVGEVTGVLQLGAGTDLRLGDRGGIAARGTTLREHLIGDSRGFLDALGSLRPRAGEPSGAAAWEALGPHRSAAAKTEDAVVEAREADAGRDRASRIEAELSALKARMQDEGGA